MPALIASYTSAAGGSERLLLDVAGGLEEPPLIACPGGWLADNARGAGLTVFELPARSLHVRRSLRDRVGSVARVGAHSRELRRLYGDVRPDVVVAWGMRTAMATAAAMQRIPAPPPWVFVHVDFLPGGSIGRAVRAAAARADRAVCISHAVAEDLDPDARMRDRIEVIHPGVDAARFAPGTGTSNSDVPLRGAIVPWKRPDLALEIAAIATRDAPDLRLRIAGAPLDEDGEQLLRRLRERAAQPDLRGRV